VPVIPGEITSQAGWSAGPAAERLPAVVRDLKVAGIRVSLFVDPTPTAIQLAADVGADRVELYTEPYARAFASSGRHEGAGPSRSTRSDDQYVGAGFSRPSRLGDSVAERSFEEYADAARAAHAAGLGVNAGHDLDLENLVLFRHLPHLDEVSIGHAIVSRAVFVGLETVVREYLDVLRPVL
jgi:pyridoxine 5-phosphate synthase